jgi:hypothetical protein
MEQSMKRLLIHPQTASIIRASVRDAMAPDDVLAAAPKNAFEHIDAATKCRATMPDSDTAPEAHAAAVLELHARVNAADRYLEKARRRASVSLADDDAEEAETMVDLEARAIRQVTRATSAVILNAAGNQAGAKRLLRTPKRRH